MAFLWALKRDQRAAVAPTVALALTALIGVGGLAFDYAHMATLDTELQDAADQAALAAATQLDGATNARARATAAANSLLRNAAFFADRSGGAAGDPQRVAVTVTYYQSYTEASDTPGTAASSDANAKVAIVTVGARQASFALTPIIGVFNSGNLGASAVASLNSSICKVPPLMICNPNEAAGTSFPASADVGRGLKLEAGGGGTWAPGNYGYLDFGSGAKTLEELMGANSDTAPCVDASTVNTKPGNTASAPAGINTRFDIFQNGLAAYCASSGGNCSPGLNTRKDVEHVQFSSGSSPNETASNSDNCSFATGSDPWELPSIDYQPDIVTRAQAGGTPKNMGLPRDICHAVSSGGDCPSGRFGNGNWDRALYFSVNHAAGALATAATAAGKSATATTGPTALTRYDVYKWELANAATLAQRRQAETKQRLNPQGNPVGQPVKLFAYHDARCAPGLGAGANQKDRRLLTAAVVNCTSGGVQGSSHIDPIGWVDLFLVEPSIARGTLTGADQIYVEVAGVGSRPSGQNTFQYFLRQKARLLK